MTALLDISFASSLFALPVSSQQPFHTLGCGSGCALEYCTIQGPYYGEDGLRKVLVREVSTHGGGGGSPIVRKPKKSWIIADCSKSMLNLSSYSSNGQGSHADIASWIHVKRDSATTTGISV